jgi:GAF domain-containing protein
MHAADITNPQRIRGMAAYDLFNPELEKKLMAVCQRTAEHLDVQTVMVTAVLDSATAFLATNHHEDGVPVDIGDAPNEMSLSPILVRTREPYAVDDLTTHPIHATNPLVQAGVVGAYAGVPVVLPSGDVLGSFSATCPEPHHFTDADIAGLAATVEEIVEIIRQYEFAANTDRRRRRQCLSVRPRARARRRSA